MAKKTISKSTAATKRKKAREDVTLSRRGIWKGSISFGLVNVPVQLFSAKDGEQLSFNMLDKRDNARIGYKQINKSTGREIERSHIVKGYEFQKGEYVVITENDFERANVKATQMIEIEDFVLIEEVDVIYFEKPYYIVPQKGGEKGYALLREVLERTGKAGIGKVVLHRKQHLAALLVRGKYIVLEILRFAEDVLALEEGESLGPDLQDAVVTPKELQIAEQLVASLTTKWEPEKYKDTYREDLMAMIQAKIKSGHTEVGAEFNESEVRSSRSSGDLLDLTALLRKSLEASSKKKGTPKKRNA